MTSPLLASIHARFSFWGVLARLAVRNLVRHQRHTVFGLIVVVMGVSGLVIARGFVLDVFNQLGEMTIRSQLGHIQLTRAAFREAGAGRSDEYLIADSPALLEHLRSDVRVRQVMGRLNFSGVLGRDGRDLVVEGEGVEPDAERELGTLMRIIAGGELDQGKTPGVLLGEGVARRLGVKPGDWVDVTASTIDGSVNSLELRVTGIFRSFSKEYDDRAIRVALPVAWELLQTSGVTTFVFHLHRTKDTDPVLAAIRARLDERELEVLPWYRISDFYASTRALYERQFGILQAIAVILIGMSVLASFNTSVIERTAEFGTMRALGNRPGTVFALILIEAIVLGALGAVIAVVVSGVAAVGVSAVGIPMPPPPNSEIGYTARILVAPHAMLGAAAIGVLSAFLGALLPALRVTRMPLVLALGRAV